MLSFGKAIILYIAITIVAIIAALVNILFINSTETWVVVSILILFSAIMFFYSVRLFKRAEKSWEESND